MKQTLHRSNSICLKTWEKHIVKDFNYHMIIQRNQAHNSILETSVLKALLKWRDYMARIEDESPSFVMPNHVMFQMASNMPVTRNEFRDCCRSNFSSMMMKHQDEIIALINKKVTSCKDKSKKKSNHHVVFDNHILKASNPEYKGEEMEEMKIDES